MKNYSRRTRLFASQCRELNTVLINKIFGQVILKRFMYRAPIGNFHESRPRGFRYIAFNHDVEGNFAASSVAGR
jgi:hypothetical protein